MQNVITGNTWNKPRITNAPVHQICSRIVTCQCVLMSSWLKDVHRVWLFFFFLMTPSARSVGAAWSRASLHFTQPPFCRQSLPFFILWFPVVLYNLVQVSLNAYVTVLNTLYLKMAPSVLIVQKLTRQGRGSNNTTGTGDDDMKNAQQDNCATHKYRNIIQINNK